MMMKGKFVWIAALIIALSFVFVGCEEDETLFTEIGVNPLGFSVDNPALTVVKNATTAATVAVLSGQTVTFDYAAGTDGQAGSDASTGFWIEIPAGGLKYTYIIVHYTAVITTAPTAGIKMGVKQGKTLDYPAFELTALAGAGSAPSPASPAGNQAVTASGKFVVPTAALTNTDKTGFILFNPDTWATANVPQKYAITITRLQASMSN